MTGWERVASLEASCRAALPALTEREVGGWLLRASGGPTKRVNSAQPITADARAPHIIEPAERFYAEHRLPNRFRLTPLADECADAMLDAAGFEFTDPSITMAAALTARPADPGVSLTFAVEPGWLAAVEPLSGRDAAAAAIQMRLLAGLPGPIALARIDEDGRPVAAGYASIGLGRAQLSDIVVAPAARGRGLGRRLVAALIGWAARRGCTEALLQVLAANETARRLYRSLGFTDVYPYHYRVRR